MLRWSRVDLPSLSESFWGRESGNIDGPGGRTGDVQFAGGNEGNIFMWMLVDVEGGANSNWPVQILNLYSRHERRGCSTVI
jgi:hypothetical protein